MERRIKLFALLHVYAYIKIINGPTLYIIKK